MREGSKKPADSTRKSSTVYEERRWARVCCSEPRERKIQHKTSPGLTCPTHALDPARFRMMAKQEHRARPAAPGDCALSTQAIQTIQIIEKRAERTNLWAARGRQGRSAGGRRGLGSRRRSGWRRSWPRNRSMSAQVLPKDSELPDVERLETANCKIAHPMSAASRC